MKIAEAMCREEGLDFSALLKKYEITAGHIENYEVRQNTSSAYAAYVAEVQRRKEEREKARVEFHNFIDREKRRRKKEGILKNKTVCFSAGGFYGFRAEECDYYVCLGEESGPRIKSAASRGARILTHEEFAALTARDSVRG